MEKALHLIFVFLLGSLSLSAQQLRIYHIDVEQASATLFVAPNGKTLLVDSGKNGMGGRIKTVMDRAGVSTIDFFVDTHYHEDHYGGIDDLVELGVPVVDAYDRGDKILLPGSKLREVTFQDYQAAVGNRATPMFPGMTLALDPHMTVTCISSGGIVLGENSPVIGSNDENNLSISLLITLGSFRYFIGGDIQSPTEEKIADYDLVKDVDVYIADHHGSETSSTTAFLQDMTPHVVIISNGDNAGFHHPRQSVLRAIAQLAGPPTVFQTNKCTKGPPCGNVPDAYIGDPQSTDQDGTITLVADMATHHYTVTLDSGASWGFAFRTVLHTSTLDFDGNGKSDILWKHPDGSVAMWLMDGLGVNNVGILLGPGSEWSVRHIGDLNGDGKSDLLWQHTDGGVATWLMDGITVIGGGNLLDPGSGWHVQHVGDFNGDGKSDLLWQHPDGSVAMWLMDGTSILNDYVMLLGPGSGWSVQHVGDFNGDGKGDLLWQHADGSVATWLMDGLGVINVGILLGPGSGWSVQHMGDLNGDGKSDLLWQHIDGSVATWLMDGMAVIGGGSLLGPESGWSIHHVGDFDGNGKSDIVWRHTDGSYFIWLMNGPVADNLVGILGPATGWDVMSVRDFNGDGKGDLLWTNVDGGAAAWLMDGLNLSSGVNLLAAGNEWSPFP